MKVIHKKTIKMEHNRTLDKLNVLVTGCFAPGTSGTVLGLKKMGIGDLKIYGIDSKLVSRFIPDFHQLYEVSITEPQYIIDVLEIVKKHKIDVILPQTNSETITLSRYQNKFLGTCKIALAGDYESVKKANDKYEVLKTAFDLNIPTSNYMSFVDKKNADDLLKNYYNNSNTFYIKAKNDSGGRGIIKVVPDSELIDKLMGKPESIHVINYSFFKEFFLKNSRVLSDFFIMENFEGNEYTVDVFKSATKFIAIPRRRVKIRSGVSMINILEKNIALINASKLLSESLNLKGLFGFQYIYKSDTDFTVLECNPRIQGTNYASILAGSNLIEYLVLDLMNHDFRTIDPVWNKTFMRTSGGILVDTSK